MLYDPCGFQVRECLDVFLLDVLLGRGSGVRVCLNRRCANYVVRS